MPATDGWPTSDPVTDSTRCPSTCAWGRPAGAATVADMGRVVLAHLDPADPLRAWADGMAGGAIDVELAGHLTGSIDLILRIADGGARASWWPTTRPTR